MLNTGRFLWNAKDVEEKLDDEAAAGRFWSQDMKQAGQQDNPFWPGKKV